jgi:hypothetical protein
VIGCSTASPFLRRSVPEAALIEVDVGAAQADRLTDAQPVTVHHQRPEELGRAVNTIFLCRYLRDEGLNVIEQWNGANDFIFFARRGELTSNCHEDQEQSMLALHLLQNCMIYINMLTLQRVLARPHWGHTLEPRDLSALTPLTWEHVNPHGRFELDMYTRLPLD